MKGSCSTPAGCHFTEAAAKKEKGKKNWLHVFLSQVFSILGFVDTAQECLDHLRFSFGLSSSEHQDDICQLSRQQWKEGIQFGPAPAIDEIEPLSPCLRYSALFPPLPHPPLGGSGGDVLGPDKRKASGVNVGLPILVQIRFEGMSKWPASLNAMGAAKCAMLIQLAEGIDKMKRERGSAGTVDKDLASFDGPMDVTPKHLDIGYRGYSWRIIMR